MSSLEILVIVCICTCIGVSFLLAGYAVGVLYRLSKIRRESYKEFQICRKEDNR